MWFYTLLEVALIPVNVLVVGLFINRLLAAREREELVTKMNMAVGAFFSQHGNGLIDRMCAFDAELEANRPHLIFDETWCPRDFENHRRAVCDEDHRMDLSKSDAVELCKALEDQRPFVLALLQNSNLLEHHTFTNMLWAVSHLSEELSARRDLHDLTAPDAAHIERDMGRAYGRLLGEWLLYMCHLKAHYPYLFGYSVRSNPFNPATSVEVEA
jgi:hypothetical protein